LRRSRRCDVLRAGPIHRHLTKALGRGVTCTSGSDEQNCSATNWGEYRAGMGPLSSVRSIFDSRRSRHGKHRRRKRTRASSLQPDMAPAGPSGGKRCGLVRGRGRCGLEAGSIRSLRRERGRIRRLGATATQTCGPKSQGAERGSRSAEDPLQPGIGAPETLDHPNRWELDAAAVRCVRQLVPGRGSARLGGSGRRDAFSGGQVRPTSAVRLTRNALSSRVSAAWSPGAATVRMTDRMRQLPALS
jgi:hypothetical protein